MAKQDIQPGQRIRVFQEIERREGNWMHDTAGTVLAISVEPTGSWHARGKDGRLWLTRIRLRKDNGEVTTIVSDRYTRLEVLGDKPST